MRALRIIAVVLAAAAGIALLSAWLLPQFLNWDHYRSAIERVASTALGRPVQIGGAIRLSLLPEAVLTASDVTVSDIGDGASAEAAEIRVRVALQGLLTGRLNPQDVVLDNPSLHLPWPLKPVTLRADTPLGGLHAKIANGQLWVGGLQVSGINGELGVDPATGTLSAAGLATVMARPWRMTGRLGRPGADGSFTIEISLDGQGAEIGTGAALSGQVDARGELVGQVSGRGPDLSLLLPAPAQAWHADGRITAGRGLAVADDLDFDIGGAPARGAVALRLLPALRLDVALQASRMSLDDWLPPLLHGGRTALPTGIDLSAEAATLAGGTLRQLRAGFEMTQAGRCGALGRGGAARRCDGGGERHAERSSWRPVSWRGRDRDAGRGADLGLAAAASARHCRSPAARPGARASPDGERDRRCAQLRPKQDGG